MYMTSVVVLVPGPPSVMMSAWSNTWNEPITDVTITKNMAGDSIGSVMRVNRCHGPAPSTVAASYSCPGIACSPARKMTIPKPKPFHTLIRISPGIAQLDETSQPVGMYSHTQTNAIATVTVAYGSSSNDRNTAMRRSPVFSSSASARLTTMVSGTETNVK